jgi:hypothetical protein
MIVSYSIHLIHPSYANTIDCTKFTPSIVYIPLNSIHHHNHPFLQGPSFIASIHPIHPILSMPKSVTYPVTFATFVTSSLNQRRVRSAFHYRKVPVRSARSVSFASSAAFPFDHRSRSPPPIIVTSSYTPIS